MWWTRFICYRFRRGEGRERTEKKKKRKQIRIACSICNDKEKWVLKTKLLCQFGLFDVLVRN